MRIGLVVGLLVVALVLVAGASRLLANRPHSVRPGQPETIPAAVALTYAQSVQVHDTQVACGVMTVAAARAAGCGGASPRPRGCGQFTIEDTKIVHFSGSRATVQVGTCRIELVPGARTDWAVSKVESS